MADNNLEETPEDFEARIAAIEAGSTKVEVAPISTSGYTGNSDNETKDTTLSEEKPEVKLDKGESSGEKNSEKVDSTEEDNQTSDEIKTEDDTINQYNEGNNDVANVDDEKEIDGDNANNEINLLEKFGLKDEKDLEQVLSELKKTRMIIDDNKADLGTAKLLKNAGVTEEDIGILLAIKAGDKGTILDLAKKAEIDLNEEVEPKDYKLDEFKPSDIDEKIDGFLYDAKAKSVSPDSVIKVMESWDEESVVRLLSEKDSQGAIINHVSDGTYEEVMDKISEIKKTDYLGKFSGKDMYSQYTYALSQLNNDKESTQVENGSGSKKAEPKPAKSENVEAKINNTQVNNDDASGASDSAFVNNGNDNKQSIKSAYDTSAMNAEEYEEYIDGILSGKIKT